MRTLIPRRVYLCARVEEDRGTRCRRAYNSPGAPLNCINPLPSRNWSSYTINVYVPAAKPAAVCTRHPAFLSIFATNFFHPSISRTRIAQSPRRHTVLPLLARGGERDERSQGTVRDAIQASRYSAIDTGYFNHRHFISHVSWKIDCIIEEDVKNLLRE